MLPFSRNNESKMEAAKNVRDGVSEFGINPTDGKRPTDLSLRDIKRKQRDTNRHVRGHLVQVPCFCPLIYAGSGKIVSEYDGRANIESLIEESKNQIAMAKIPGKRLRPTLHPSSVRQCCPATDNAFHIRGARCHTSRFKHCISQPGLGR